MKIKTSFITASVLRDQCNVSEGLIEQINNLPVKADIVYLHVDQVEMKRAAVALKEFMDLSDNYHVETFASVLKEIEYFASDGT
jgi:uncharacterized protein (DUF1919 family)